MKKHVDAKHLEILRSFEHESILQWKDVLKNNLLKKGKHIRFIHFLFFVSKEPFKINDVDQIVFGESYIFGCKNPFSFAICEKCMVKAIDLAFVSLSSVFFTKVLFTWCFASPNGGNHVDICFVSLWRTSFCH